MVSLGERVWGRVQVGGRGWFPVENEGKGNGLGTVGGEVGTDKSMRRRLSKLPLGKLPFSFSPMWGRGVLCLSTISGPIFFVIS